MAATPVDPEFEELLEYLRTSRGFDFTGYKRPSITRRVLKRMNAIGIDSFAAYRDLLEAQPDEFIDLFNTILINVTGFLRDKDAWEYLASSVLPRIMEGKGPDEPIRVWSAGCASGEETYSLAVLLCDAVGEERFRQHVKLYGTDADDDAIGTARRARYPVRPLSDVFKSEQVERYFEQENGDLAFRKDLRRSVIFGRHDLVRDPPISRVDLLVCRNTLMYFTADSQRRVLASFHFALVEGGFLFVGKSEALVTRTNLFKADDQKQHIFVKHSGKPVPRPPLPPPASRMRIQPDDTRLLELSFEAAPIAHLVVNREGILVHANRHARTLFGLGLGQVGRPFRDLEVSYRPIELRSQIENVMTERRPVTINDVEFDLPGGGADYVEIAVLPIMNDGQMLGVSLTFAQTGRYKALREELERSQRELESAYEELQSTVEELETTNEELQSTNEELETTNEELHSSNEELETMNEELQSTNEELETINNELRQRSADLDQLSAFHDSVLASLGFGVVVLDHDLGIRVWNAEAEDLWGLRDDEVESVHFLNLDIGLPVDDLRRPIRACLSGRSAGEQVTLDAVNRRGRQIECRVTVSPLRSADGEIHGVIMLMEKQEPAS